MTAARQKRVRSVVATAGICAMALTACGTTVRHHHSATLGSSELSAGSDSTTAADGSTATGTGTAPDGSGTSGDDTAAAPSASAATGTGDTGASATIPGATGTGTGVTSTGTGTVTSTGTTPKTAVSTTTTKTGTVTKAATTTKKASAKPTVTKTTAATATAANPNGPATGSPVQVGFGYFSDLGAAAASFGGSADAGNEMTEIQTAVNYVNAHGGLDGHVISPVFAAIALTNPSPYSTEEATVCSTWAEDNHVVMGIFVGAAIPNDLATCLNTHGVAYMSGGGYLHDKTDYQNLPNLISPIEAGVDRVEPALINEMFSSGFLTSKDKLGVLLASNEGAAVRAYNNIIVPMLKAKGVAVTSYEVDYATSTAAIANEETQISNDELHARTDGVTKVISLKPGAIGTFMGDANQQGYTPQYAVTSLDSPEGLITQPAAQLAGSIGLGWQPGFDVPTYGKTDYDTNPTRKFCKTTVEQSSGQETGELSESASILMCSSVLDLQAAVDKVHAATITGGTVVQGFNELGNSFTDGFTFSTNFSASQHDGASIYRPLAFQASCTCYAYTGAPVSF